MLNNCIYLSCIYIEIPVYPEVSNALKLGISWILVYTRKFRLNSKVPVYTELSFALKSGIHWLAVHPEFLYALKLGKY